MLRVAPMTKVKLSDVERLLLANQYRILEQLLPEEGYEHAREIVVNGYEGDYHSLFNELMSPVPEDVCEEVIQVFELHRRLHLSYRDMPEADRDGIDPNSIRFRGFDGNHEGRHMDYAQFRLGETGMWDELHSRDGFYNSHSPMLPRYRAMMAAVKRMAPGSLRDLTTHELKEVLKLGADAE